MSEQVTCWQEKLKELEDSGEAFSLATEAQEYFKPELLTISDKQRRRNQAGALIEPAHAVVAATSVHPPPAAKVSRPPRAARRTKYRKWESGVDGVLGFTHYKGCTNVCDCASSASLEQAESGNPAMFKDSVLKFEDPVRGSLCPLGGLKKVPGQLSPMSSNGVTWEKVTLTVDSGASDTVIPPNCLSWAQLIHTDKVGLEYEVANGEVVHNLGERRCMMRISEKDKEELEISFQVVEDVHKPLLAVSSIVEQGHEVIFAKDSARILLSSGVSIPMRYLNGTYELDIWVKNPGFTRPSGR